MSRDLKPRKVVPARKSRGGTLFGLFIGLVIGVIGVAAVVWYINKAPLPFTTNGQQPKLAPPAVGKPATTSQEAPKVAALPAPLPGKPGDPISPEKPRFDFYKILPGQAEAIPDPKPEEAKPLPSKSVEAKPEEGKAAEHKPVDSKPAEAKVAVVKPAESRPAEVKPTEGKTAETTRSSKEATLKEPIYLQAGSFQSASEADNQKARLALLGAEARIQQVMLQDKVWYRVRLGPYHKMDDVNHLRADLARQGIDANLVRKD